MNKISPIPKIGKQVDQEWLYRKKYCGPTLEDLSILYPPDPILDFNLVQSNMNANDSISNKNETHLQAELDNETLYPKYSLNISINDLFGDIDMNICDKLINSQNEVNLLKENIMNQAMML